MTRLCPAMAPMRDHPSDAVLKGNDRSPRAQQRSQRMRGGLGVIELDQKITRSTGPISAGSELTERRRDGQVSERAFDPQPAPT
jgi:hypothetical protein